MKSFSPHFILAIALFPVAASATIVSTFTDEDNGSLGGGTGISLREAVAYSAPGSSITFAPGLSGQTIRLSLGPLQVFKLLSIDASSLTDGLTLSADRTGNGKTSDDTYVILLTGGSLLLDSLLLTGANCAESSGCITIRPSVTFTLTLDHCTLTANAGYHASALYCFDYSTWPTDAIAIRNSTISRNSVVKGASVIQVAYRNFTVEKSTFSQNDAGAISYRSAGSKGTLSISHSTISGNSSNYGAGGLYIDNDGINPPGTIYINNTICTGNKPANIYNASPGAAITGSNNLLSGDPRLAPLGDYGGPSHTMPPLPGSPALSGGPITSADIAAFPTDQRGLPRRIDSYHIGAVHYQGASELRRFWNLDFDGDGNPFGIEVGLGTDPLLSDATSPRNLSVSTRDPSGHPVIHFGYGSQYFDYAKWVLKRSSTLSPGSFQEIYRFSPISTVPQPGITHRRDSSGDTITDTTAPAEGAFYLIEGISP